jgi:hypothetical protein
MDYLTSKTNTKSFFAIAIFMGGLLIACSTRIMSIGMTDIGGDGAINSFRALGWFDWLGISGQSTPFDWLGHIPLWAKLSFHDAPPLVFFIQHLFFNLFGENVVVARLPFILSGIFTLFIVYLILKKLKGIEVAFIGVIVYAVISYSVWTEHSLYLEGIQGLFITGYLLLGAFLMFGQNYIRNNLYLYLWISIIALALITKYTSLFIFLPTILFMWTYRFKLFKNLRTVLLSLSIFLIIILPVIFYNIKTYVLRGHFDAALSSLFGMQSDDFWIISQRHVSLDLLSNTFSLFKVLISNISIPFLILIVISIVFIVIFSIKRLKIDQIKNIESWIVINLLSVVSMFLFFPASERFVSIIIPVLVIGCAVGMGNIYEHVQHRPIVKGISIIILISVCSFELFYSINTNILKNPIGPIGFTSSKNKLIGKGFNQLDNFIRSEAIEPLPNKKYINNRDDIRFSNEDIEGKHIIIYDDRIDWASQMWYMQRYFLYYRLPIISTSYFIRNSNNYLDINQLADISGVSLYFIYPIHQSVIDNKRSVNKELINVAESFVERFDIIGTTTMVYNNAGVPVFKVYKILKL